MTSRGQGPRGGACECPRVGVFVIFWRADDVTRTKSKGGGGVCECLDPPPPFRKYPRLLVPHIPPASSGSIALLS